MHPAMRLRKMLLVPGTWRWNAAVRDVTAWIERKILGLALLLVVLPLSALAQVVDPNAAAAVSVDSPLVSLLMLLISSGVAVKIIGLIVDVFAAWNNSRGAKRNAALNELALLARAGIGQTDADQKALRLKFSSPESDGGVAITANEARQLQDAALASMKSYATNPERITDLLRVAGVALNAGDSFLRGVIETEFQAKKRAEAAAQAAPLYQVQVPDTNAVVLSDSPAAPSPR